MFFMYKVIIKMFRGILIFKVLIIIRFNIVIIDIKWK